MNYKQGLSLVREAAVFGLDMQSQVLIALEKTPANHYPNLDCEMPPHISIWCDWETWCDFLGHLQCEWGWVPCNNYYMETPQATGDEGVHIFYLRDKD